MQILSQPDKSPTIESGLKINLFVSNFLRPKIQRFYSLTAVRPSVDLNFQIFVQKFVDRFLLKILLVDSSLLRKVFAQNFRSSQNLHIRSITIKIN